jgi:VWFA-related protein
VRRLFQVLVLSLLSAICFGGSIVYLRVHRDVLEERLKAQPDASADYPRSLRKLFETAGCTPADIAEQPVPKQTLPNVLCRLPGKEPGTIVVSAPIDFADTDTDARDASHWATIAMLPLLAESLVSAPHRFSVVLVGFAGHDHGLRGSAEFLRTLSDDQRSEIRAMISLDHLGRTPMVYALGQSDPALGNWLSVAANSLRMRALPAEMTARTVEARMANGKSTFDVENYLLDAKSFERAHVPSIALQSAPSSMLAAIRQQGSWPDNISAGTFDLDLYEQSYNQLCVFVLLLDSNLGTSHAAPPTMMASAAAAPSATQPATATAITSSPASAAAPEAAVTRPPEAASAPSVVATKQSPPLPPDVPVFHAQTELVLTDVSVVDAKGNTVHGLQASDFTLVENGEPQQIRSFEEHSTRPSDAASQTAALPPGTYSNQLAVTENAPLGILLFDLLNTPPQDQSRARAQMIQYLKNMPKHEHVALFILGTDLRVIQGFTDDSKSLVQAAEKVIRQSSPLFTTQAQQQHEQGFTDEIGSHAQPTVPSQAPASAVSALHAAANDGIIGSVANRTASSKAVDASRNDQRTTITLDALAAIARAVAGYPGRKNMIWLSGSFEIRLHPAENTFLALGSRIAQANTPVSDLSETGSYQEAIRRVSTLLAAARLAVYPIDVRGVATSGVDISLGADQARGFVDPGNNDSFNQLLQNQSETRYDERSSMSDLARQTGGQMFIDNDIKGDISRSIEEGSNYYTIAYSPAKKSDEKNFRVVSIKVNRPGVKLAYRPGYYPVSEKDAVNQSAAKTLASAMQPGLPPSTMLLLTAKVQPPDASSRAVRIDYNINAAGISFADNADRSRLAVLDCMAVALDSSGKIAGQVANRMDAHVSTDQLTANGNVLPMHQELLLPPGTYDLRLGVIDRASQRVGTISLALVVPPGPAADKQ